MSLFWGCIPLPPRARGARTPEASPQGASYQDHQAARAKRWSHARGPGQRAADPHKDIKDKSEALRAYARQARNPQLEADAWEIKKPAEDRLGALSAALEKAPPMQGRGAGLPAGGQTKATALRNAGISTSAANRYEQFHQLPRAEKETRIAKGRAAIEAGKSIADAVIRQGDKKERRSGREQLLATVIRALPNEKYGVIVADPEWRFEPWSRDTSMDRATREIAPSTGPLCAKAPSGQTRPPANSHFLISPKKSPASGR